MQVYLVELGKDFNLKFICFFFVLKLGDKIYVTKNKRLVADLKETDPDTSLKVLLKDYMNLFNKYFPKQVIKDSRKNHNWFDDELKKLLSNKEALFKKYMQIKSPETKRQFTKARNLYFRKIQQKNKNTLKINWNLIKTT